MPPPPGLASVAVESGVGREFYEACGYRVIAGRAIRVDILDRLAIRLRRAAKKGSFAMTPQMINPVGLNTRDAVAVFMELGYATVGTEDAPLFVRRDRNRSPTRTTDDGSTAGRRRRQPGDHINSPFAKLRELQTPK